MQVPVINRRRRWEWQAAAGGAADRTADMAGEKPTKRWMDRLKKQVNLPISVSDAASDGKKAHEPVVRTEETTATDGPLTAAARASETAANFIAEPAPKRSFFRSITDKLTFLRMPSQSKASEEVAEVEASRDQDLSPFIPEQVSDQSESEYSTPAAGHEGVALSLDVAVDAVAEATETVDTCHVDHSDTFAGKALEVSGTRDADEAEQIAGTEDDEPVFIAEVRPSQMKRGSPAEPSDAIAKKRAIDTKVPSEDVTERADQANLQDHVPSCCSSGKNGARKRRSERRMLQRVARWTHRSFC